MLAGGNRDSKSHCECHLMYYHLLPTLIVQSTLSIFVYFTREIYVYRSSFFDHVPFRTKAIFVVYFLLLVSMWWALLGY
jgi:hypothetical protein